jgi:hypothetical protein
MKWATITTALLPLVTASGFTHQQYASGEVMELMMNGKEVSLRKKNNLSDKKRRRQILAVSSRSSGRFQLLKLLATTTFVSHGG